MSHKPGAHLGGIRCVDDLRARSIVDEDTGCWHWRLSLRSGGRAWVHFVAPETGRYINRNGRRAALHLSRGVAVPKGHIAFARLQCKSEDCVNPAHSRCATKAEWGKWLSRTGKVKGLPSKHAASRKGWAKRERALTDEMVAEIRVSQEATGALAKRFGVSTFAVYSVRKGLTHRSDIHGASVFSWRPELARVA